MFGVTEADLIQTVASEANRQSMRASKRTVSGEHVEQAIEVRRLMSGLVLQLGLLLACLEGVVAEQQLRALCAVQLILPEFLEEGLSESKASACSLSLCIKPT